MNGVLAVAPGIIALGRSREAASEGGDFGPYATAFAAIDTDHAQLLVVATDRMDVVATMQLSFIPGLARRGALRAQVEAVRGRRKPSRPGSGSRHVPVGH